MTAKLRLAGEILATYVRVRWMLRRLGLRESLATLRSSPTARFALPAADDIAVCRRLGRAVMRTLALIPADSRCLMQSLVLTRLLARRGLDSQLAIAVRPGERFAAHAWVERGGVPLLPPEAPSFERLVML